MNRLKIVVFACMLPMSRVAEAQFGPPPATGQLLRAQPVPLSGQSQNGAVVPTETAAPGGGANSVNTINPSIQIQGAFQGGIPSGTVSAQPLSLRLLEAVQRGLMHNLGRVEAGEAARNARARRLAAVAQLLPDLTGHVSETVQQINLVAEGLRISVPIPGFTFPKIVGPFNNFDAWANFTESVSLTGLRNWRSSARSAELSLKDSRELVALARLIGLPIAQAFTLADEIPYREAPAPNLDSLIQRAFSTRADVQAARPQVKAAELAKQAASAERYPSLDLQESVATAEQDYITALFAYNLAQVSLARAVGQTAQGIALLVDGLVGGR